LEFGDACPDKLMLSPGFAAMIWTLCAFELVIKMPADMETERTIAASASTVNALYPECI
jgi:hypothetical protein